MPSRSVPKPYTANPLVLVGQDFLLFLKITFTWPITAGLLSIVMPWRKYGSGPLDELYLSCPNVYALILHSILVVAQLSFLASLVTSAFVGIPVPFYTPVYVGYIVFFVFANQWATWLLNGSRRPFQSKFQNDPDPRHKGEKWVFINGVAAGSHWLQSNLDRLAMTFKRPITGIHNQTRGIIFDVIECVIQRDLYFATEDIRSAYAEILHLLSDNDTKKVVLILHSQGAIEGCMVLDWLLATLPTAQVSKLEIYTFGNASNHWNSPIVSHLDSEGQRIEECAVPGPGERLLRHIEHYANDGDYVSLFGILHFRPKHEAVDSLSRTLSDLHRRQQIQRREQQEELNRFVGKLFKRKGSGHQMNQHYLDNMFAMDDRMETVLESNPFMDGYVDLDTFDTYDTVEHVKAQQAGKKYIQVKELSRLWKYRNGGVPDD